MVRLSDVTDVWLPASDIPSELKAGSDDGEAFVSVEQAETKIARMSISMYAVQFSRFFISISLHTTNQDHDFIVHGNLSV